MRIKILLLILTLVGQQFTQKDTIQESSFLLKNGDIQLPGSLTYNDKCEQLIIWVHGSGNVDRNGNQTGYNVKANYIKQLRDELNKNNIAFYSYDKRTANPKNVAFLKGIVLDDFVSDVKVAIKHFKEEDKFKEIILIGHSQGSLVAMLASKEADKFISLAGPSESIDETIIKQITSQSTDLGKVTKAHFKELKETGYIKDVNPNLISVFAKPNFPFYKNWMSYDPMKEINKIEIPTLIINGTKDIQVSVKDAKNLHEASRNSELKIISNMNHVLKDIQKEEDNMASYYSPDFKISKALINHITEFVKK